MMDEIFNVTIVTGFMTDDECQQVLDLTAPMKWEHGMVATGDGLVESTHRNSTFVTLTDYKSADWLYEKIKALKDWANGMYKFDIDRMEPLQVARYGELEYYCPHIDLGPGHAATRKLSVVVQLSDPEDYDHGELTTAQPEATVPRSRGTAVVFPSFVMHGVSTVTRGNRYSLAAWFHGPRFK